MSACVAFCNAAVTNFLDFINVALCRAKKKTIRTASTLCASRSPGNPVNNYFMSNIRLRFDYGIFAIAVCHCVDACSLAQMQWKKTKKKRGKNGITLDAHYSNNL